MHVKYEPDDLSDLKSLLRPFSTKIWIFVSATITFSSIIFLMTDYFTVKMSKDPKNYSNLENLFAPLQLLLNQGKLNGHTS